MPRRSCFAVITLLCVLVPIASARAQCTEDLSGNRVVDVADILIIIGAWGQCEGECPEDVNEDGVVDVADLLLVLAAWGPCLFEYPQYENELAELIGIEYVGADGPLTLDPTVYERMARDIELISSEHPEGVGGPHFGDWVPYRLGLVVDLTVPRDELDHLVEYFQAEIIAEWFEGAIILIDFPSGINIPALVPIFEALTPVEVAEPDGWDALPVVTPGWFPEDIGNGALEWLFAVPWYEGHICDPNFECCRCWTTYQYLTREDGSWALLDTTSGRYPCGQQEGTDCSVYP